MISSAHARPVLTASDEWRQAFRRVNRVMVLLWRLGMGGWVNASPRYGGQVMVLTHTGRKSGRLYRQPLNYAWVDGALYCIAGFGATSNWYKNILANPQVQVWLPDEAWRGTAEDVSDEPGRLRRMRAVIRASGFAGRLAGLDADTMTDDELDALTHEYCVLRVRRASVGTPADRPGDLTWVWLPVGLATFVWLIARRRNK